MVNLPLQHHTRFVGVKLILISSYLLVLFLILRLLDVVWLTCGMSRWGAEVQPSSLPAKALKEILEQRGVSLHNVVEKSDLVRLVEDSGYVSNVGISHLLPTESTIGNVIHFTDGAHFYRQMDRSSEFWLVLILVGSSATPNMADKSWSLFRHRVSQCNIRLGFFHCGKDPEWCKKRKLSTSQFQLVFPKNFNEKPRSHNYNPDSLIPVYHWILRILQGRLIRFYTPAKLKSKWIKFRDPLQRPEVHVVIFTDRDLLPPFTLALSTQYPDLAQFAWVRVKNGKDMLLNWTGSVSTSTEDLRLPRILLATHEGVYVYGQAPHQCYAQACLKTFLDHFKPSQNVLFNVSVVVAIVFGMLEAVIFKKRLTRRVTINSFFNVCVVIIGWLLPDAGFNLQNRMLRYLAISRLGALVRGDVIVCLHNYPFLLLSLLPAALLMKMFTSQLLGDIDEKEMGETEGHDMVNDRGLSPRVRVHPNRNEDSDTEEEDSGTEEEDSGTEEEDIRYRARLLPVQIASERESFQPSDRIRTQGSNHNVNDWRSAAGETPRQAGVTIRMLGQDIDVADIRNNRLTPQAEEMLLNFLHLRVMESLSNASGPRHVSSDLPVWQWDAESQEPEGFRAEPMCVICQEEFCQGDRMTGLPCKHIFHYACLVRWLNQGATQACPLCRN